MPISALRFGFANRRLRSNLRALQAFAQARRSRRVPSNINFLLRASIGLWLCARLIGCAAAPDPTRFADATRSLATSVRAIGVETHQQLGVSPATQDAAGKFEQHWSARNNALRAASDYSTSLVTTFAQAHATQPTDLSQHLQALAQALGVGTGIEAGVGVLAATADTIAFIHAQIALVQASRNLEEAIVRAQPVIDRIAELIVADTDDLEKLIRASATVQRLSLAEEFNDALAFGESVDRRRSEILRLSYSQMRPSDLDEIARIDGLKASVAADLAPYFKRLASIDQRESDTLEAIQSTRAAIESWAAAHRTLAQTARTNQPPDTTQLIEAIATLNTLMIRLRTV